LFGARISSGTVDAILARTAAALAEPHADLLQQLRASPALNMDETGWRTAGQRRALWGLFDQSHAYAYKTPAFTIYRASQVPPTGFEPVYSLRLASGR
jgi:hypothetical protein